MSHNTFTYSKDSDWVYCQSHNFPEFKGRGANQQQAWNDMNNQITEYSQRDKNSFVKRCKERNLSGLECNCGHPLTEEIVGIVGV